VCNNVFAGEVREIEGWRYTSRRRYAARLRYLRRDASSTRGSRRSGAAAWRMGPPWTGGVFHEEPVVAPTSPSMRPTSLNASRFPGAPAAPWWEGLAALGAHAGGRRSGLASLERDPDAGRDREQEWPVTAVLVEPAVGEFPDLSAPGLLEFGRRSQA
jgi:hypothetical protein